MGGLVATIGHLDAEEVAETNLGYVVGNVLVVHESIRLNLRIDSRLDRDIGLIQSG